MRVGCSPAAPFSAFSSNRLRSARSAAQALLLLLLWPFPEGWSEPTTCGLQHDLPEWVRGLHKQRLEVGAPPLATSKTLEKYPWFHIYEYHIIQIQFV